MITARLPETLSPKRFNDLEVGESGWTVPWSLYMTPGRELWINPEGSVTTYGGTACLEIKRETYGWVVALHNATYSNTGTAERQTISPKEIPEDRASRLGLEPVARFIDAQK